MLWGCFLTPRIQKLVSVEGNMDWAKCKVILETFPVSILPKLLWCVSNPKLTVRMVQSKSRPKSVWESVARRKLLFTNILHPIWHSWQSSLARRMGYQDLDVQTHIPEDLQPKQDLPSTDPAVYLLCCSINLYVTIKTTFNRKIFCVNQMAKKCGQAQDYRRYLLPSK